MTQQMQKKLANGLKGQDNLAQGNALGMKPNRTERPERAAYKMSTFILPLQGEFDGGVRKPSPLGWAKIYCTFGAFDSTQSSKGNSVNSYKMKKNKGLLSVELVVAIGVLATIIAVLAALGNSFGKLNSALWAQHTCYAAGQAQMDCIAVTGKPIDPAKFESLWPTVTCEIETADGTGQWQGLTQVQLFLSVKDVQVQMARYLPSDKGATHDN